jgi:arylsulfatase A-like enzyme
MGYERDTSPVMDAFCRRSVRFRRVVAQSSRSIRSIPAVFTGRYPSQVAYGSEYLWPSLLRENQTFAEALRERRLRDRRHHGHRLLHARGRLLPGLSSR